MDFHELRIEDMQPMDATLFVGFEHVGEMRTCASTSSESVHIGDLFKKNGMLRIACRLQDWQGGGWKGFPITFTGFTVEQVLKLPGKLPEYQFRKKLIAMPADMSIYAAAKLALPHMSRFPHGTEGRQAYEALCIAIERKERSS